MDTGGLCWPCLHCLHPLRSTMQINPNERAAEGLWGGGGGGGRDGGVVQKKKREREKAGK